MTQAYLELVDVVDLVRKSYRARRAAEGAMLAAAIALGVLVVAVLADKFADFGHPGRTVLAFIFYVVLLGALWRCIGRPLWAHHSDDYFAALVEQRQPTLGNRLINALQLGRVESPRAPRLVDAIVSDAVLALDDVDLGSAVSSRALRRNLGALAGVVAIALLAAGPAARTSLARVLMPAADIAPYTWTQIDVTMQPDGPVLAGEPLRVNIKTRRRLPDAAAVHWQDANEREHAVMAQGSGLGVFNHTFESAWRGMAFQIRAGDASTAPIQVVVHRRPQIESMSAVLDYPPYTGLPQRIVESFDGPAHGVVGTKVRLTVQCNKALDRLEVKRAAAPGPGSKPIRVQAGADARSWHIAFDITSSTTYRITMHDSDGYEVEQPQTYTITAQRDAPPLIHLHRPGRDVERAPDDNIDLGIVADDDFGVGPVRLLARINRASDTVVVNTWSNDGPPQKRVSLDWARTMQELNLSAGSTMEYWAEVADRNDVSGPGTAQSPHYHITVLTPALAGELMNAKLEDYIRYLEALIKLQRQNRAATASLADAPALVNRQSDIRRQTMHLVDVMQQQSFPGRTIINDLTELAGGTMVQVVAHLESYRDAEGLEPRKAHANASLPLQDLIIKTLEDILVRLNRDSQVRKALRKIKKEQPAEFAKVADQFEKLAKDLQDFLTQIKELDEKYERMPKRPTDELAGEQETELNEAEHRLDRWKKWAKDTVDELAKLPANLTKNTQLTENLNTIFEEIEKKKRPKTKEIATPLEEGAKMLGTEVLEDLEIWMMDHGDDLRWVMEDPTEGIFKVPPYTLPEELQDWIGDLIEDMDEFDMDADDITGAWGGNMPQAGWDIMDGPISVFSAQGKTGNQLPNSSEMTGLSGGGRRGRSSGQMVGSESRALEGRPTPARVTNDPYQEGDIQAGKQLDPRGATGGGKKTGAGRRGLQGGTPPDFVKQNERMTEKQHVLEERMQLLARRFMQAGRPATRVNRALQLLEQAGQNVRDQRYEDAARQRKMALGELRAASIDVDSAVNLSLQQARHLPPNLRRQISAGMQQAIPEGYEDLVAQYYKRLSQAAGK